MIDVEEDVFNYVYPYVAPLCAEGCFNSEFVPSPVGLPHATLIEMDNYTDRQLRGTKDTEEYAILTYEANAYANSKPECRQVMDALDTAMTTLGFTRIESRFIPNLDNTVLYRMVARYRAGANADKTIFRHG